MQDYPRVRWVRAEVLRDLGRDREALAWYVTLAEDTDARWEQYQAPARLRIAQLRERLGEKREAANQYRRFIALWRDADPEVQPLVDDAERHLAALEH
jgi:predicted RNA polymerase sigma factor